MTTIFVQGIGAQAQTHYLVGDLPPDIIRLDPTWVELARSCILAHAIKWDANRQMSYSYPQHDEGQKVPSVKVIREHFGISLAQAKNSYECALAQLVEEDRVRA